MISKGKVKDIYALSPMQKGIFYHAVHDRAGMAYFEQRAYRYFGKIDERLFHLSIEKLAERHDVLSSVFLHEGLKEPFQVLIRDRKPEVSFKDFRSYGTEVDQQVETYKENDRKRGFRLDQDALLRITILCLDHECFEIIWSFHHILFDGWSLGILNRELWQCYKQLEKGEKLQFQVAKPYSSYVKWLIASDMSQAQAYWKQYLNGYSQIAEVPKKKQVSQQKLFKKGEVLLNLGVQDTDRFKQYARDNQFTLNSVIQILWGITLAKYQQINDVVFGTVVSGRPSSIQLVETIVGLFINTIPVRLNFSNNPPVKDVIRKAQREFSEGEPYHYYPLSDINADSALGNNLFDHILVFENYPFEVDNEEKDKSGDISIFTQSNYDLNVVVFPGDNLVIKINFNEYVYDRSFIENIPGHLQCVLHDLLGKDEVRISELNILSDQEQSDMLTLGRGPVSSHSKDHLLSVFNATVASYGDSIAVVDEGNALSYHELDKLSSQLCRYMQEVEEVRPGQTIGVMIDRSADLLVSMLAVLKAGGVYIPLDIDQPKSRRQHIINDAGINLILTETVHLLELSAHYQGGMFFIDSQQNNLEEYSGDIMEPCSDFADPVYAIYTSGSTGVPKGVLIGGQSLLNLCYWHQEAFGVTHLSRATIYAGIGFDASIWEIWPYLLRGGTLYPITAEKRLDLPSLVSSIAEHKITHCFLPTPVCEQVSNLPQSSFPAGLTVLTGGDRLHDVDIPCINLVNNYGPTEGTVVSTSVAVEKNTGKDISIGRPIINSSAYVLDAGRKLLPAGVTGELYISGAHLALGYLNNPELTAERFIDNPYGKGGEKMYATGDLCRWENDGQLYFAGRSDCQVKIRGYRVEPGEVESYLAKHPKIECAYVEVLDTGTDKRLIGYYQGDVIVPSSQLKTYMGQGLPSYMIPDHFIFLQEVPLTANGKVDRAALPMPDESTLVSQGEYIGPRTDVESALVSVWEEILGINPISIHANFFEIGGHSLKAVQMVATVNARMQTDIEHKDAFLYTTIATLADFVSQKEVVARAPLCPIEEQDYYEVSHAQKRLWILDKLQENQTAYNIPTASVINKSIDHKSLNQSLRMLYEKHESLRTVFVTVDGQPKQKVLDLNTVDYEADFLDWTNTADSYNKAIAFAGEDSIKPFDLSQGPLMRVTLIKISEKQFVLIFAVHHIIVDAVSMQNMVSELLRHYNDVRKNKVVDLQTLGIQYKDFSAWQNTQLNSEKLNGHQAFWTGQFKQPVQPVNFPADFTRPEVFNSSGRFIHFELDSKLTGGIKAINKKFDSTLFITGLTLVNILLQKYTGQNDIVIGTPVAGRDDHQLLGQIGFYVNMLALRNHIRGEETFSSLLKEVKHNVLECYNHQVYPFDKLVNDLRLERDRSRSPLFDIVVTADVFENTNGKAVNPADLATDDLEPLIQDRSLEICKYDLRFRFSEIREKIYVNILYNQALFKQERMLILKERLIALLTEVVLDAGKKVSEYNMEATFEKRNADQKIVADFDF